MTPPLNKRQGAGESPLPHGGRGLGEGDAHTFSLLKMARELRVNATDAEALMWNVLRNRHVLGNKFRRQHRVLGFIADFACTEQKLIIELDGGQHNTPEGIARDAKRTALLTQAGWRVLRF